MAALTVDLITPLIGFSRKKFSKNLTNMQTKYIWSILFLSQKKPPALAFIIHSISKDKIKLALYTMNVKQGEDGVKYQDLKKIIEFAITIFLCLLKLMPNLNKFPCKNLMTF